MTLSDVFDQLAYGEFSKIFLGESGAIPQASWNRIIAHINLGLTELYKRFDLKQVELPVEVLAGTLDYDLKEGGDFIEILHVFNSDNVEIPLNNRVTAINKEWGAAQAVVDRVHTNVPSVLSVNPQMLPQVLTVVYKAGHVPIPKIADAALDGFDLAGVQIDLPVTYLEALLYFVASRIFNPLDLSNVAGRQPFHSGNNYYSKYEAACAQLMSKGLDISEKLETGLFQRKGFI